jgi:hypothetical protein
VGLGLSKHRDAAMGKLSLIFFLLRFHMQKLKELDVTLFGLMTMFYGSDNVP